MYLYIYIFILACMLGRFSCVQLLVTLWAVAREAPVSMDSPGKYTGVGRHALLQRIFPTRPKSKSLTSPALTIKFFTPSTTWEAHINMNIYIYFLCTETIHFWRFTLELVTVIVSRERIHIDGRQE